MSRAYVHTLAPKIAEMQHRSHEPSSSNSPNHADIAHDSLNQTRILQNRCFDAAKKKRTFAIAGLKRKQQNLKLIMTVRVFLGTTEYKKKLETGREWVGSPGRWGNGGP